MTEQAFGSAHVISRGQLKGVTSLPGLVAVKDNTVPGALPYNPGKEGAEIVALNNPEAGRYGHMKMR